MSVLSMRPKAKPREDKPEAARAAMARGSDANCVVSKGTRIEGDFSSTESIRLDGIIVGQLRCDKRLVIGEAGKVEGKVNAADAVIMGHIQGDVVVSGSLQLMGTARIEGDIQARVLAVEEGAVYYGKCQVGGKGH